VSRAAQAVARQVEELRGKMKRERRRPVVDGPEDAPKGAETNDATTNDAETTTTVTEDVTERLSAGSPNDEPVADQNVEQTGATTTMAKKTTAKKAKGSARNGARKAAAKATARKTAPRATGERSRGSRLESLPTVGSMQPTEILAEEKNVYVTMKFGDFVVRLKPVNFDGPTTDKVRDLMVSYFKKALL
jgi:hypothetical protein